MCPLTFRRFRKPRVYAQMVKNCKECNQEFSTSIYVDGKRIGRTHRTRCWSCCPYNKTADKKKEVRECERPECKNKTSNTRFCSQSCAAKETNKVPKRKKTKECMNPGCSSLILASRSYCSLQCRVDGPSPTAVDWNLVSLGDVRNKAKYQANAQVRNISRRAYKAAGKPMYCLKCRYSLHVDICHVKAVSSFSDDTPISTINHPDNLVALCKNHHWEFDHGYLALSA